MQRTRVVSRFVFLTILLIAPATASLAGPIYALENAVCAGGNQLYVDVGEGHLELACNPVLQSMLRMRFDYLPGSAFDYSQDRDGAVVRVRRLQVVEGHFGFAEDFSDTWPDCWPCRLEGSMPVVSGRTDFFMNWWEGWFLRTTADGQWLFGVEFGGDGTEDCADRRCLPHYYSWGTYDGWRAISVDQPATVSMLGLGILALGMLGLGSGRCKSVR